MNSHRTGPKPPRLTSDRLRHKVPAHYPAMAVGTCPALEGTAGRRSLPGPRPPTTAETLYVALDRLPYRYPPLSPAIVPSRRLQAQAPVPRPPREYTRSCAQPSWANPPTGPTSICLAPGTRLGMSDVGMSDVDNLRLERIHCQHIAEAF